MLFKSKDSKLFFWFWAVLGLINVALVVFAGSWVNLIMIPICVFMCYMNYQGAKEAENPVFKKR